MTDPVDFIPAGSATCCCEQASWLGKRPNAAPLTDTFIRTAVKGGSIVPPPDGIDGTQRGLGLLLVLGTCALTAYLIAHYWPL